MAKKGEAIWCRIRHKRLHYPPEVSGSVDTWNRIFAAADCCSKMESKRVMPLSATGTQANMMVRMWSAAKRARAYGRSQAHEKDALFCATLIARLGQTLNATAMVIDPMQHCWLDRPGMLDGHIHSALSSLEAEDPDCGWLVRNALGLGVVEDQRGKSAARLQAMVNLAWIQASMPLVKKHGSGGLTTERSMRV